MSEIELKRCPFCGGEAERRKNTFLGDNSMAHCRTCGASAYDRKWNDRAQSDFDARIRSAIERKAEPVAWIAKSRWERMTNAEPWLTNIVYSEDQSNYFDCIPLYSTPPAAPESFECSARKQSLPEPSDCNWPVCGCDPLASKVIEALEESGVLCIIDKPEAGEDSLRKAEEEIAELIQGAWKARQVGDLHGWSTRAKGRIREIFGALSTPPPEMIERKSEPACVACEDRPSAENNPCAVCGASTPPAEPEERKATPEMFKAACDAYDASIEMQPREHTQALYEALSAALSTTPAEPVASGQHLDLLQALSRLSGNRQSDGISSLVSREDREAIINGCYDLMIAARRSPPPSPVGESRDDALIERLVKALSAFAEAADILDREYGDKMKPDTGCNIKFSALCEARAALIAAKEQP